MKKIRLVLICPFLMRQGTDWGSFFYKKKYTGGRNQESNGIIKNKKFFHAMVQYSKKKFSITSISDDSGNTFTTFEDIMNGAIAYYQTFFTSQGTRHYEDILSIIPPLLSDDTQFIENS